MKKTTSEVESFAGRGKMDSLTYEIHTYTKSSKRPLNANYSAKRNEKKIKQYKHNSVRILWLTN